MISKMKKYSFFLFYSLLVMLLLGIYLFTCNNFSFYKESIGKVIDEDSIYLSTTEVTFGYKDAMYEQTLRVRILNSEYKDKEVIITNEYDDGLAYYDKYTKGDVVFLNINESTKGELVASISGVKRDTYVVLITIIFILSIVFVGHIKGCFSIVSVLANIAIFLLIIKLNSKGLNLIFLTSIAVVFFCILGLLFASGWNKNTWCAILSSILGLSITMLISLLVMHFTNAQGVHFEQMELLTRPYKEVFVSEILVAGLGAIMDIAITITSSFKELINKNPKITKKELIKSGKEIGKDVTGTMINVLFFTYICGCIPTLVILFRNGVLISEIRTQYISLEMVRAITGAIGITITIPIAIFLSILIVRRNEK